MVVGASNAVNLTDGLDGLAIGPVMIAGVTYAIFTYVSGHSGMAEYLQVPYVAGSGEVAIFCGSLAAAGLGFLWFNAYPAQMFMGDVGSLSLGAALGIVALISKQEIVLAIVGGVFVIEAASVIFQVSSYKLRRRNASSVWLHCITILSCWAGRNRLSLFAFGLSPSSVPWLP